MRIDWFLSRFLKCPLWLWNGLPWSVGHRSVSPWSNAFVIELTMGGFKGKVVWEAEQGQIGALWHFSFCALSWLLFIVSGSLWHAWEHWDPSDHWPTDVLSMRTSHNFIFTVGITSFIRFLALLNQEVERDWMGLRWAKDESETGRLSWWMQWRVFCSKATSSK